MANQDWSNLGDEIKNIVQSAIDSQNFKQLNESIGKTINTAMANLNQGISEANEKRDKMESGYIHRGREYSVSKAGPQNPWEVHNHTQRGEVVKGKDARLYKNISGMRGGGIALAIVGYILAGGIGLGILALLMISLFTRNIGLGQTISLSILAPLLVGSGIIAGMGTRMLGRAKRFQTYIRGLRGRTFCSIKELAGFIGKSENFVRRDVKDMLYRHMFLQGHMDYQQSCLIVSDEAYGQYQAAQAQLEERQKTAKNIAAKPATADEKQIPPAARRVIEEGTVFIDQIKKSNDAIQGEEISAKISKMEHITRKIFSRVEQQPELVSELHKFIGYYLPTTVKLLNAYEELEEQPIQGANILSSKREIEGTLDTINQAFENLLDSFFQDTAWDISSDISVLQTMLAQEGLTNSDFVTKDKTCK